MLCFGNVVLWLLVSWCIYCLILVLPPALQLTHYDADTPSHRPPSPARSGSGGQTPRSPSADENGESPTVSKTQAPLDDHDRRTAKSTQKKGGRLADVDERDHGGRSSRQIHSAVDSSSHPYPRQLSYESEPDHLQSLSGRKTSSGGWCQHMYPHVPACRLACLSALLTPWTLHYYGNNVGYIFLMKGHLAKGLRWNFRFSFAHICSYRI